MKYLSPEIEALSKSFQEGKSLVRPGVSCGIFQECDFKEAHYSVFVSPELKPSSK